MLRSPLGVRISNPTFDRHITNRIEDVEFSTAAPGGFDTAAFEMKKLLDDMPEELVVESAVFIYDIRNGRTVWEGKLTDPGRSLDDSGNKWSMTAMGPKKHASDRFSPYIAIDTNLEGWQQTYSPVAEATASITSLPGNEDVNCLLLLYPAGLAVANGDTINARYDLIGDAGMRIGAFRYTHQEGFIPAPASDWQALGGTRSIGGGDTITNTQSYDTATRTIGAQYTGPDFTTNDDQLIFRNKRNAAATNVLGDKVWAGMTAFYVIARMFDKTGTAITGASSYPIGYLTADLIVTDIISRFCPLYDLVNANIDVVTYQIDQFAYATGARPSDMLDDLALFHPNKRFCAWETNPATRKYSVEWTGWGAQPRYEATVEDGLDLPGSSTDLYSQVTVQGLDPRGRTKSRVVVTTDETTLRLLNGLVREADPIDLGAEVFTTANADRIGGQFLATNAAPPASGTLTVRHPIRDLLTGRTTQPWELRAGSLVRLRGTTPNDSGVNAADRDGASVFRLVNTTFRDSDGTASLTLDTPSYTIDQLLARYARRRQRH